MSNIIPVGIDLGTTFCAVAHLDSTGHPTTIRNADGDLTTSSVVFLDRDDAIVGKQAVDAGLQEPERLVMYAKRDMGEKLIEHAPVGQQFPPEVIQAIVLRKLKADAELKLGPITKAVVTVPSYFNEPCRQATVDAAKLAGIDLIDIINEPTAAAITFGVEKGFLDARGEVLSDEVILVYDLGGGTFDVTLMKIDGTNFLAVASDGEVYLGGVDFDLRIAEFIAQEFEKEFSENPKDDDLSWHELLSKANSAKHALSARESTNIFISHNGHRFRTEFTRKQFEEITSDLIDRTRITVERVLTQSQLGWNDLTRILLVGGSSRMPAVEKMLKDRSGRDVDRSLSPDEAIAHGAALYAGFCLNSESTLHYGISVTNVSSHDLGVLGIEKNLDRQRRKIMIPRNSALPTERTKSFTTASDNQSSIKVEIIEGGDDSGNNSTAIGRCVIRDLPPSLPANTPVDVTFRYGNNGRLVVEACLPKTGAQAVLSLNRAAGLAPEELDEWQKRLDLGVGVDSISKHQAHSTSDPIVKTTDPTAASNEITTKKTSWKDRSKKLTGGTE